MEQWRHLWKMIFDSRVFIKNNSFSIRRNISTGTKSSVSNNYCKDDRETWFCIPSPIVVDRRTSKIATSNASLSPDCFLKNLASRSNRIRIPRSRKDQRNQVLTWILVDDGSSCNILYEDALEPLGLTRTYLNPFGREDLLAFNNSVTHPCRAIYLKMLIGKGTHQRRVNLTFLVV